MTVVRRDAQHQAVQQSTLIQSKQSQSQLCFTEVTLYHD